MKQEIKTLVNEFEVRDALGGSLSGDYVLDLQRLIKKGKYCSERLYNEAYQNTMQP